MRLENHSTPWALRYQYLNQYDINIFNLKYIGDTDNIGNFFVFSLCPQYIKEYDDDDDDDDDDDVHFPSSFKKLS